MERWHEKFHEEPTNEERIVQNTRSPGTWALKGCGRSKWGFLPPTSEQSLGPLSLISHHPHNWLSSEGKDKHTLPFHAASSKKVRDETLLPNHTVLRWSSLPSSLDSRSPCLSEGLTENSWIAFPPQTIKTPTVPAENYGISHESDELHSPDTLSGNHWRQSQ